MKIFLILCVIILISTKITKDNYEIQIDQLMNIVLYERVSVYYANQKIKYLHYRGKPGNMEEMRENDEYKPYSSVYIKETVYKNEVEKFPKSTVFFVSYSNYFDDIKNYGDYYFVVCNYDFNDRISYVIVSLDLDDSFKDYVIIFIVIFSLVLVLFILVYCCFYNLPGLHKVYANNVAYWNLFFSIIISFSCLTFKYVYPSSLFYSIYKSYMIIEIIYFLNGFLKIFFLQI